MPKRRNEYLEGTAKPPRYTVVYYEGFDCDDLNENDVV